MVEYVVHPPYREKLSVIVSLPDPHVDGCALHTGNRALQRSAGERVTVQS
jgi:hypothetical protein